MLGEDSDLGEDGDFVLANDGLANDVLSSFETNSTLTKDDLDEVIESCLQEKQLPLISVIENKLLCHLGERDCKYIEAKCIETLEEFWQNKASEQIANVFDPKQPLLLLELVQSINSFQDCYKLFGCLEKYTYLITELSKNSASLKSQENILVNKLKQKCYIYIANQTDSIKDEVCFFKKFIDAVKGTKDLKSLCNVLLLDSFIQNKVTLKDILSNLKNQQPLCPKLRRLKHSATAILNKEEVFFEEHLKELITAYLKPYEVHEKMCDGRMTLEVSGKHLIASKILQNIENSTGTRFVFIEEVRFVNFGVLHVDTDFKAAKWHGKNIVVVGETVIIEEGKAIIWDVSGKAGESLEEDTAGTSDDGFGIKGTDGNPGESGGNVYIGVDNVENSMNLTIISNGGKGSKGQNGGIGKDGEKGNSIDKHKFKQDFPPVSHIIHKEKHLETTLDNVLKNVLSVDMFYYGLNELNMPKEKFYLFIKNEYKNLKSIYFEVTTLEGCKIKFSFCNESLSFCQSFLLYKGSPGMEGSPGGAAGFGGNGGFAGDIKIEVSQDLNLHIDKIATNGEDGKKGEGGKSGVCGSSGLDRGYMDKTLSFWHEILSSESWPKLFILNEEDSSRLTVKFSSDQSPKLVWCPFNNLYGEITKVKKNIQTEEVFQGTLDVTENENHGIQAKRKKGIDSKSIFEQYKQKDSLFNIHSLDVSLNKAQQELEDTIRSSSNLSEKIEHKEKVSRQISYFSSNSFHFQNPFPEVNIENAIKSCMEDQDNSQLLQPLVENPKLASNWTRLRNTRLNIQELNSIWELAKTNVFPQQHSNDKDWSHVTRILHVKYQLATLEHINNMLSKDLILNRNYSKSTLTDGRFLSENSVSVSENHSHLRHVERYFIEDSLPLRQEIVRKCFEYSTDESPLSNTLDKLIFEFMDDERSDPTISGLCNCYCEFNTNKNIKLKEKFLPLRNELFAKKNQDLFDLFLEATKEQNVESEVKFQKHISKDRFLAYIYRKFSDENKKKYSWDRDCTIHMEKVLSFLSKVMVDRGPLSASYREFLAQHFNVNIIVFKMNANNVMELLDDHNPRANTSIHILLKNIKFSKLNYDYAFAELIENKYKPLSSLCNKVMFDLSCFSTKEEYDEYVSKSLFMSVSYSGNLDSSSLMQMKISQIMSQDENITIICKYFDFEEDVELLKDKLKKLGSEFIGSNDILHFMALNFLTEKSLLSGKELSFIVNLIIKFYLKESEAMPLVSWIIATHPHSHWLIELGVLMLELYFKQVLNQEVKAEWRKYLRDQYEKEGIMLFLQKLVCEKHHISMEAVTEILKLMSTIPKAHIGLEQFELREWKYYLKDRFWAQLLKSVIYWSEDQLKTGTYYLTILENLVGIDLTNGLVRVLKQHSVEMSNEKNKNLVLSLLNNFVSKEVCINDTLWEKLNKTTVSNWQKVIDEESINTGVERDIEQLIKLIGNSGNTSKNILNHLIDVKKLSELTNSMIQELQPLKEEDIKHLFSTIRSPSVTDSSLFEKTKQCIVSLLPIENSFERMLKVALNTVKTGIITFVTDQSHNSLVKQTKPCLEPRTEEKEELSLRASLLLSLVSLAIQFKKQIKLRNAQKLTILTFLKNKKNTLAQVSTGEGKSLIVVALAIIKALCNEKVNIITSSKVLAERDAENLKDIYELCGVSVGHCCSENVDDRKKVYSNCHVIYGDLANFQRDYLLDRIYDKNIIGDCSFETVIVDEVDSMLLDKGNNVLYLSHDMPGFDKLEPIFIYIWKYINRSVSVQNFEELLSVQEIKQNAMFEIFGQIKQEHLKKLDSNLTDKQVISTWNFLVKKGIIDSSGKCLKEDIAECFLDDITEDCVSKAHLIYFLRKVIEREKTIYIPKYLEMFVEDHLEEWIVSGINALAMKSERDYVIDIDRHDTSSDINPNITILDRDTGTDLVHSQWDKGLHQFLQLKHGCRLSLMSLKAVFISNVSYLKLYQTLYGLTGTLGSKQERELVGEIYNVDFVTIPTAKAKNFNEETSLFCSNFEEWKEAIYKQVCKVTTTRSALIICETVNEVKVLKKVFDDNNKRVHTYIRDFETLDVAKDLQTGQIIISTNLAGRGTDITLSEKLVNAGGLHVCLTFLPKNRRIEEQAFGRAARNGEPGSAQLIFKNVFQGYSNTSSKVIDIKKQRDHNELIRLSEIKSHHENQIELQEKWFSKFMELYKKLRQVNQDNEIKSIFLKAFLDQWAFWLDKKTQALQHLPTRNTPNFVNLFQNFDVNTIEFGENFDILSNQINDPAHLIKLGLAHMDKKDNAKAVQLFDRVIKEEPFFSEAALYYKIKALTAQDDLFDNAYINDFKSVLKKLKQRAECVTLSALEVDWLKEHDLNNQSQIEAFKTQQINIRKIYHYYIQSIYDIIGFEIHPYTFKIPALIEDHTSAYIYNRLVEEKQITKPLFKTVIEEKELLFVKYYGLSPLKTKMFLKRYEGKIFDQREFLKCFKKECELPSRELFWKELVDNKALIREEECVFINIEQLTLIHPSLFYKLKQLSLNANDISNNEIWLYNPQELLGPSGSIKQLLIFKKKEFQKIVGSNIYQFFEEKELLTHNKLASINFTQDVTFKHFDFIGKEHFTSVNIFEDTASEILHDLVVQNVVQQKGSSYTLLIGGDKINNIELTSHKIYTDETISLLKLQFSFRITLEKLKFMLTDNVNPNDICIPLATSLHEKLILQLTEKEIILGSFVSPKCNIKKELNRLWPKNITSEQFKVLFAGLFEVSRIHEIFDRLIEKKWLIRCKLPNPENETYSINEQIKAVLPQIKQTSNTKNISLPQSLGSDFDNDLDTIIVTLLAYYHLVGNLYVVENILSQSVGLCSKVNTPSFSLHSLTNEQPCSHELELFTLNGFDQLMVLEEKRFTWKTKRNILFICMLGVIELAVGIALGIGLGPNVFGTKMMAEGISDLQFAINCMISGHCSLRNYFFCKAQNIALTVFYTIPMKNPFRSGFGAVFQSSKQSNTNMLGKLIKEGSTKIAVAVTQGVIYATADQAIESHFSQISDEITELIFSRIDETIESHSVSTEVMNLHCRFSSEDSKKRLDVCFSKYLNEFSNVLDKDWLITVELLFKGIINSMPMLNLKELKKENIFPLVLAFVKFIPNIKNNFDQCRDILKSLQNHVSNILDKIEEDLQSVIYLDQIKRGSEPAFTVPSSERESFSCNILNVWKREIRKALSDIVHEKIVKPVLHKITNRLTKCTSRYIMKGCRAEQLKFKKRQSKPFFQKEKVKSLNQKEDIQNNGHDMYDECLLQLLEKKRNATVFAEVLKKKLPVDTHFVELCCSIIPSALKSEGIQLPSFEIILIQNGKHKVFYTSNQKKGVPSIVIVLDGDLKTNIMSNKTLVQDGINLLINKIFQSHPEYKNLPVQELRNLVANVVEKYFEKPHNFVDWQPEEEVCKYDFKINTIVERKNPYQHNHFEGKWIFKAKLDVDLRNDEKLTYAYQIEDHISEGFQLALHKINNHINHTQSHLKNFKLSFCDFSVERFEIVPQTRKSMKGNCHCYPVQYALVMPFVCDDIGKKLVAFNITMNMQSNIKKVKPHCPHGPHIVYEIKPIDHYKYFVKGTKGHILLNEECREYTSTANDCNLAGELIIPSGFELQRKCEIVILGESILRNTPELTSFPNFALRSYPNIKELESRVADLTLFYKEVHYLVLCPGDSVAKSRKSAGEIARDIADAAREACVYFGSAIMVICSLLKKTDVGAQKVLHTNKILKLFCSNKNFVYLEINDFIQQKDVEGDGIHLKRRSVHEILQNVQHLKTKPHIKNT